MTPYSFPLLPAVIFNTHTLMESSLSVARPYSIINKKLQRFRSNIVIQF